jgi:heme/copper-type cytochrome/quinol oxidase subunit 4
LLQVPPILRTHRGPHSESRRKNVGVIFSIGLIMLPVLMVIYLKFTFLGTCHVMGTMEFSQSSSTLLISAFMTFKARLGTKQAPFIWSPTYFHRCSMNGSRLVNSTNCIPLSPFPHRKHMWVSGSSSGINIL